MTTYLRAPEAARRLGVTTATLYSYVSRGRIGRTLGSDGRSSLFDLADVDALIASSSRPVPPPPTIDVRISTSITNLDESGVRYRGVLLEDLVDEPFERVCGLLWNGSLGEHHRVAESHALPPHGSSPLNVLAIIRMAVDIDPDLDPIDAATRLLDAIVRTEHGGSPHALYADRLIRCWVDDPSPQLTRAVNSTLVLLADHGLATSTLAVRVAASVRTSPIASLIAGLATVEGELHGAASSHVLRLFEQVEADGAVSVLQEYRCSKRRVPGFGHKIYRNRDPRFQLLLDRVRALPDQRGRLSVVDDTIDAAGALVSRPPNVDLALGALAYVADLPADLPVFAVARIAGWTAHHLEELQESPVRFRGLAN